ncbi:MAG: HlyC/CorC family transporter [Pseudomonadota bacterium]|nr:HlyC/CorC family transporter [Pseudomonadota bacterium]QKK06026.1 MAG: HlyC/CorC family transporter [Pseudomonadota bacterium]
MDMYIWGTGLAILALLLCSGFFSGSETALTASSRARIHAMFRKGNKRAAAVKQLQEQKERLIGAILLGNNLVNILASALATSLLITLFGETGVVYATLGMTVLVLVFAEVLPKTYAINNAERMALAVSPVLRPLVFLLAPITDTVTKIVETTLKMFGVHLDREDDDEDPDIELRGAIDLQRQKTEEEEKAEAHAMLRSILDLADVDVSDIMVHRRNVMMIDAGQETAALVEEVLSSPYTRLPVWQETPDNIVGILHTKMLLRELNRCEGDMKEFTIENCMFEPWFIPESTTLFDQLQEFRRRREHFAVIVDEYGSLVGVVTLEDILEEIVGEITDEHDVAAIQTRFQPDGSYLIDGKATIRDLNRQLDWDLPDEDYATLAGLILHESQSIPKIGQTFSFYGFRFEVLRRQRNQITLVRVVPVRPEEDGEEQASG